MGLEIEILCKLPRADSCAVDHEIEFAIHLFEFVEVDIRVNFAASPAKTRGEVVEINRCVRQRDAQRETAGETIVILSEAERSRRIPRRKLEASASGFDSLTSRSLSLRPSRPCRGSRKRSILDSARNDRCEDFIRVFLPRNANP